MGISKIKDLFKRRIPEKLACLLIAIVLFVYVKGEEEKIVEYNAPLVIKNMPDNISISKISAKETSVVLRGPNQSFNLVPSTIEAYINVTNSTEGQYKYNIMLGSKLPKNIKYTFSPSMIDVVFEPVVSKDVPVKPNISLKPPSGIVVAEYKIEPSHATIYGAKSIIDKIAYLYTKPIDLSSQSEDASFDSKIVYGEGIKILDDNAKVNFIFTKDIAQKEYYSITPLIYGLKNNFYIKSKIIVKSIVLEGTKLDIENLKEEDVLLSIDLNFIEKSGKYANIEINADLPENINIISIEPKELSITVSENK